MSIPRIVVTGIGASSPIGGTAPESWSALLGGASGARTLEYDWVEQYNLPVTFAAQAAVRPDTVLERPIAKRLDPSSQFALVAAMEAWADAGSPEVDPERLGVDFATGIGGLWTLLDAWDTLREKGPRRVLPMTVPMLMPNAAAGNLSLHFGARAYARTVASACASCGVRLSRKAGANSPVLRLLNGPAMNCATRAILWRTISSGRMKTVCPPCRPRRMASGTSWVFTQARHHA